MTPDDILNEAKLDLARNHLDSESLQLLLKAHETLVDAHGSFLAALASSLVAVELEAQHRPTVSTFLERLAYSLLHARTHLSSDVLQSRDAVYSDWQTLLGNFRSDLNSPT